MRMNFGERFQVEDLGHHRASIVINLALLLARTVNVRPDHKRKHFYEIEDRSRVYYVYVSPLTRIVFLLASWRNMLPPLPQLDAGIPATT